MKENITLENLFKPTLVDHPLFHKPTEIKSALKEVASQKGNNNPDYGLMEKAANQINVLEMLYVIAHREFQNVLSEEKEKYESLKRQLNVLEKRCSQVDKKFFKIYESISNGEFVSLSDLNEIDH